MNFMKLGLALSFCAVASCSNRDDFSGNWKEIHNSPAEQTFLQISSNGSNDLLTTTHSQAIVGNQIASATHKDIGVRSSSGLQIANGLITLTIDKATGHLIFPKADRTWEFERGT